MKRLAVILLAGALLLGAAPALAQVKPEVEFTFSTPDAPRAAEDAYRSLLLNVAPNATIHASQFRLSVPRVATAYVHAAEVGELHFLTNQNITQGTNTSMQRVRSAADELYSRPWVGVNHNKFLLIDKLADGRQWVVLQSSSNMTKGQRRFANATVVEYDNKRLYDGMLEYWDSIRDGNPAASKVRAGSSKALTFPHVPTGHPFKRALSGARCDLGATILISTAAWKRVDVAYATRSAADQGCTVRLITNEAATHEITLALVDHPNIEVALKAGDARVHSKWLTTDSFGPSGKPATWSGSYNTNDKAKQSADTVVRYRTDEAWGAFSAAFEDDWGR